MDLPAETLPFAPEDFATVVFKVAPGDTEVADGMATFLPTLENGMEDFGGASFSSTPDIGVEVLVDFEHRLTFDLIDFVATVETVLADLTTAFSSVALSGSEDA